MKWQEHFKSTLPGGKTKPSLTCAEVRELAGESWPDVSDQCPTLRAARRRNRPSHGFGNSAAEGRRIGTSETAEGADARPPLSRSNVGRCSTWLTTIVSREQSRVTITTSKRKSRASLRSSFPRACWTSLACWNSRLTGSGNTAAWLMAPKSTC